MRSSKSWILALASVAALSMTATACGGEATYEFDDLTVGDEESADTPQRRSNSQFLRLVYADLVGRTPEVFDLVVTFGAESFAFPLDETAFLMAALDGVGDPTPMRNLIVAGLVHSDEVSIPEKDDVSDPEQFIRDQFRALLGRNPGEYELRAFMDEWNGDDSVNPRTIIRALIASREYQSY